MHGMLTWLCWWVVCHNVGDSIVRHAANQYFLLSATTTSLHYDLETSPTSWWTVLTVHVACTICWGVGGFSSTWCRMVVAADRRKLSICHMPNYGVICVETCHPSTKSGEHAMEFYLAGAQFSKGSYCHEQFLTPQTSSYDPWIHGLPQYPQLHLCNWLLTCIGKFHMYAVILLAFNQVVCTLPVQGCVLRSVGRSKG